MTDDLPLRPARDRKKPCLVLLGEFSSGKSTLANILMKHARSPVRVTATQVPPIWYSLGSGPPIRITDDGAETPLDGDDLAAVPIAGTRAVKVFVEADILMMCDIVDMPGSSDPNMAAGIWDAILPMADAAIWCTPATQAWRQSEAAIWEDVPEALQRRSALLLTRIDKVRSPVEVARVEARVRHEVRGQFAGVFPVALLSAQHADEDEDAWRRSGMTDVLDHLADQLEADGCRTRAERAGGRRPLPRPSTLRRCGAPAPGGCVTAATPAPIPTRCSPRVRPTRSRPCTARAGGAAAREPVAPSPGRPPDRRGSGLAPRLRQTPPGRDPMRRTRPRHPRHRARWCRGASPRGGASVTAATGPSAAQPDGRIADLTGWSRRRTCRRPGDAVYRSDAHPPRGHP